MFWKRVNFPSKRFTRSISTRLTLFYTLTSLIAVAIFTSALYWKLTVNFHAEHLRFLQAKVHELSEDFRESHDHAAGLLAEIHKETAGTALRQYAARVLLGQQDLPGGTPGMDVALPPGIFPAPTTTDTVTTAATRDWYHHQHHYLLVSFSPAAAQSPATAYTVQLALDVSRDDALLAEYRRGLLIFLLLLIPVLAAAGHLVTQRGLRPLERVTRAANAVTPSHLAYRIPLAPPWPPELTDLVRVFNDMMQRLDEAFARLARFSADLAHELRTPLNNLMGETEVCLARKRDAAEYRKTLVSGLEECRRLAALIENLLFIARAEKAQPDIYLQDFEAHDACAQVIEQHRTAALTRGVQLGCTGNAWLKADPLLFRQALDNLLANAIRYAPPGSEVRVAIRPVSGAGVEIEVSDHGPGISTEHLPHVFDRFYQADPARVRHGQGTGLGLAIVRSIMTLHAGEASIESRPGQGTVVRLRFPENSTAAQMTKLSSV